MPYYVSIGRAIIDQNNQLGRDNPPIIVTFKGENAAMRQWRCHGISIEGSASFHTWEGGQSWRPLSVTVWAQIHPPFIIRIRKPDGITERITIETDPPPAELLHKEPRAS